ncbi:MAG: MFS transporter [Vicinamibacterales bacterium]
MYSVDWAGLLTRPLRRASVGDVSADKTAPSNQAAGSIRGWLPAVSATVWALGLTSFFTDVSSEMVASILPMYLVLQLGMRPVDFGIIDGLYQGVAALVRVAAGVLADRRGRHKEVATAGYALSALCRPALLAAGSAWTAIAGIVAIDRIGKGVRTAPRDAMISLSTPSRDLGTAFGVHRGLDAAGAMLGPLLAFLLLAAMPRRFDVLFAVSFAAALVGLGIIILCVNPAAEQSGAAAAPMSWRRALDVFRSPRFRAILIAGFVLGVPTISDAFVFLSLQSRLQIGVSAFPLFYVGTSLFTAMFAVPFGRVADRYGRTPVLLGGHVLLAIVYATLLVPQTSTILALVSLALLGAYYAATDGVLTAMAAAVLAPATTGTGLSLLATATNVSKLVASVVFGLMWTRVGIASATGTYLAGLTLAVVGAAVLLTRTSSLPLSPDSRTRRES